jgi:hypothetical protein
MNLISLYVGLAIGYAAAIVTVLIGEILDRIWDHFRHR